MQFFFLLYLRLKSHRLMEKRQNNNVEKACAIHQEDNAVIIMDHIIIAHNLDLNVEKFVEMGFAWIRQNTVVMDINNTVIVFNLDHIVENDVEKQHASVQINIVVGQMEFINIFAHNLNHNVQKKYGKNYF